MLYKPLTFRDILVQLSKDLIGKDSHRGVTLTYTWLANQFGHFSLGFIPTLILTYSLYDLKGIRSPELYSAAFITGFWIAFELFNFFGPLLYHGVDKHFRIRKLQYTFPPAWGNIAFDTVTDILFFSLGSLVAASILESNQVSVIISLMISAFLLPASRYWYLTKMYLQSARYPYQMRLSQWTYNIDDEDKETVDRFLARGRSGQHILIFGSESINKSALSIAIATEKSIQHEQCLYLSAIRLFSLLKNHNSLSNSPVEQNLDWRNVSTLVIDDISPDDPVPLESIPASKFKELLAENIPEDLNRHNLRNKNVIWVLGNDSPDGAYSRQWQEMLCSLDVDSNNIHQVNLNRISRVIRLKAGYDYHMQNLPDAAGFSH